MDRYLRVPSDEHGSLRPEAGGEGVDIYRLMLEVPCTHKVAF